MTDHDQPDFTALMKRLGTIFRVREVDSLSSTYFRALRPFALADLERAADAWTAKESRFPKPAEWRGSLLPDAGRLHDIPVMIPREVREAMRAESLGYEDAPCGCDLCVQAGVHEKPLRFVPEFNDDDTDRKVFNPAQNRVMTAGHWAHGAELFRLYDAQASFWNTCYERGLMTPFGKKKIERLPFEEQLKAIFSKKEKVTPFTPKPEGTA